MKRIKEETLNQALKKALSSGGEYADIYIEETTPLTIQLEDNNIEKIVSGVDCGAGIRVILNGRSAYAYTNDLSEGSLESLAERLSSAVKEGCSRLNDIDLSYAATPFSMDIKVYPSGVEMERKIRILRDADRAARGVSSKVKQVKAIYRDSVQKVTVASSDGRMTRDERVHTLALIQVVASDGDLIQTGYEPVGGLKGFELFDETALDMIAVRAAESAVRMLSARRAPGGKMPVVISADAGGTMIHEAVGHGLEADLVQQGLSVFAGMIGRQIASPIVTIIDDASLMGRRGTFRFDDEGIEGQRTVLVEGGVLKGYMYDVLTAMKDDVCSTGNGRRESYRHRPIPRMSNTFIAPGNDEPSGIIRTADNGLFVKKMGGGQVNTVTGEFVFEVSEAYLIEKGAVGEPVRGATLIGNGPAVIKSIDKVGTDLDFAIGTCGKDGQGVPVSDAMPTIRIPEMVVGGEV